MSRMKNILSIILLLFIAVSAFAQDDLKSQLTGVDYT